MSARKCLKTDRDPSTSFWSLFTIPRASVRLSSNSPPEDSRAVHTSELMNCPPLIDPSVPVLFSYPSSGLLTCLFVPLLALHPIISLHLFISPSICSHPLYSHSDASFHPSHLSIIHPLGRPSPPTFPHSRLSCLFGCCFLDAA